MEWDKLTNRLKFNILIGESSIDSGLLAECEDLVEAIKSGASKERCIEIIDANF